MRKSNNSTTKARIDQLLTAPPRCGCWNTRPKLISCLLYMLTCLSSASAVSADEGRILKYVEDREIKKITSCTWEETCFPDKEVPQRKFFSEIATEGFQSWRTRIREADRELNFRIHLPDPSDPLSAVLIERDPNDLVGAYRLRPDGREEEFRSPLTLSEPLYRNLIYVSRSKLSDLIGMEWGEKYELSSLRKRLGFERVVDLNTFFIGTQPELFSRWSRLYDSTNPQRRKLDGWWIFKSLKHVSKYSWTSTGNLRLEYSIIQFDRDDIFSSWLIERVSGILTGAFRVRLNGVEEEYRPIYGQPDLPPGKYYRVQHLRRKKSSHPEDLKEVAYEYPTSDELKRKNGVPWGAPYQEVVSSRLVRGYQLQDPRTFFDEGDWYMPSWKAGAQAAMRAAKISTGAWASSDLRYYIFLNARVSAMRIVAFTESSPEALNRVFEYSGDGRMTVLSMPAERVRKTPGVPGMFQEFVIDYVEENFQTEELIWGEEPREFLAHVPPRLLKHVACPYEGPVIVDDPVHFFETSGRAFSAWAEKIDNLKNSGSDVYRTDHSVSDRNGSRYFVRRNLCWQTRESEKPAWHVLEYQDEKLSRIYSYDSQWVETIYEPVVFPELEEVLPEGSIEAFQRCKSDCEYCSNTAARLLDVYGNRFAPAKARDLLERMKKLGELCEVQAADSRVVDPGNFYAMASSTNSIRGSIGTIILLLMSLSGFSIARQKRKKQRFRRAAHAREMGFDD